MSTPDALPLLTPGAHLDPADGACLMELVSVLAGQRWSDRPSGTDPTLATIARVVNDELSDIVRRRLAPLAATLVGRTGDPTRMAPAIVEAALQVAQRHLASPAPRLDRHRSRAARRLAARRRFLPAWLYARGPAQHAITAMTLALRRLPVDRRDAALLAVLQAALDSVPPREAAGPRPGGPSRIGDEWEVR
jgi:hypothetical protein